MKDKFPRWMLITSVSAIALYSGFSFLSNSEEKTLKQPTVASSVQDLARQTIANHPVFFEKNLGQFDDEVSYVARGKTTTLFLTPNEALYSWREHDDPKTTRDGQPAKAVSNSPQESRQYSLSMKLGIGHSDRVFEGTKTLPGKTSYLKGNNRSKWIRGAPTYSQVRLNEAFQGIDLLWNGHANGEVEYDFIVKPEADPTSISWLITGANSVFVDEAGVLVLETAGGTVRHGKPTSYQEIDDAKTEVVSNWNVRKTNSDLKDTTEYIVEFDVEEYDSSKVLVIDPTVNLNQLEFSTFLGGSFDNDRGTGIALDSAGNIYVVGDALSSNFPTTPNGFDTTHAMDSDVFVSKLNPGGNFLIYSTFLGGDGKDNGAGIAVDGAGNAYVTGITLDHATNDFPTTPGVFQENHQGSLDLFVAKLNPAGSNLEYSTLIGGSDFDRGRAIAIDSSGNAYVTGDTDSEPDPPMTPGFPTTVGAFDTTYNGGGDMFVTKLNATGSALVYSTFMGGSNGDAGYSIAVDSAGNAFVTGETLDAPVDFPVTDASTNTGRHDVFVTKLNAAGSAQIYSTLLGGDQSDRGEGITIDSAGNAYIAGHTLNGATDYPTTTGAYDETHNGSTDAFLTKLDVTGTSIVYSTLIGGDAFDQAFGVAVDVDGNAFITGGTFDGGTDYPTTAGAFNENHNGLTDGFLTKFNSTGSALVYSTFIGHADQDQSLDVKVNSSGRPIIAGFTSSEMFPTTRDAFQPTGAQFSDYAFISSFGCQARRLDFDGDLATDVSIFRPGTGEWHLLNLTNGYSVNVFGQGTDQLVPGDYDGDCKTDIAIFRGSDVVTQYDFWGIPSSAPSIPFGFQWGSPGDIAVPGDYDGDGRDDFAVFRPSNGIWYIFRSGGGSPIIEWFGNPGDKPLSMDFDGDGRADLAVFRPINNTWYIARSTGIPRFNFDAIPFGLPGDILVPGDYDGDGRDDIATFRPSDGIWRIRRSSTGLVDYVSWGQAGDIPVPGDYDFDGRLDQAIYRNGEWWILGSTAGWVVPNPVFGLPATGDVPIPSVSTVP